MKTRPRSLGERERAKMSWMTDWPGRSAGWALPANTIWTGRSVFRTRRSRRSMSLRIIAARLYVANRRAKPIVRRRRIERVVELGEASPAGGGVGIGAATEAGDAARGRPGGEPAGRLEAEALDQAADEAGGEQVAGAGDVDHLGGVRRHVEVERAGRRSARRGRPSCRPRGRRRRRAGSSAPCRPSRPQSVSSSRLGGEHERAQRLRNGMKHFTPRRA